MENTVRKTGLMGGWIVLALMVGCESADNDGNFWRQEQAEAAPAAQPATTQPATTTPAQQTPGTPSSASIPAPSTAGDEVAFSSLRFTYGNFNGSGATLSAPRIANLRIAGKSMSYSWAGPTLSAWGLSDSQLAICCLFVKNSAGAWVGGKFDWISTSRTSRGLEHVTDDRYGGWTLSGVPNPCSAAFVIISADGRRRSNVIAGTWQR